MVLWLRVIIRKVSCKYSRRYKKYKKSFVVFVFGFCECRINYETTRDVAVSILDKRRHVVQQWKG